MAMDGGKVVSEDERRSAVFQRLFLCPPPDGDEVWDVTLLDAFDLAGVDNSRWHIPERPKWNLVRSVHQQFIPPISPLHAWMALCHAHCEEEEEGQKLTRLFDILLQTGCEGTLDAFDQNGCTLLIYSLRTAPNLPYDGPNLLPYRLLMAAGADATAYMDGTDSPLSTALLYKQGETVVLDILGAHQSAAVALLSTGSGCVLLLGYPALARAFLPNIAAANPDSLFDDGFPFGLDFAAELVQSADDLLWRAITVHIPPYYRLPVRDGLNALPEAKNAMPNWWERDGLRAAIYSRQTKRALWLLQHTSDDDLDSYDSEGQTVLMHAVKCSHRLDDLIIALLLRAPALNLKAPAVLGQTARDIFLAQPDYPISPPVLAAFDAAQTLATIRSAQAKPILASRLPMPPELINYIAIYAALD
jgi:hypothetical protein